MHHGRQPRNRQQESLKAGRGEVAVNQGKRVLAATAFGLAMLGLSLPAPRAQEAAPPVAAPPDEKGWLAVAAGRVEPSSQQIRLGSLTPGRVGQILVKVNDKVLAGEALIRIDNDEIHIRLAKVENEVGLRKRGRANPPLPKDAPRRQAEDASANAELAVVAAQSALDQLAAARRAGGGPEDTLNAAHLALSNARTNLQQRRDELLRFEGESPSAAPTELEAQLAAARIDLRGAQAASDNLTIRAPLDGTVLQLNARIGELTSPSAPLPLVVLADLTSMRVRAEVDEREYGKIAVGRPAVVRSDAFSGRDFMGKVVSVAPIIAPGRFGAQGQSSFTDVDVAEVLVELTGPDQLIVGMKVDVYFQR
jgi:HlyD family secretion protein